MKKKKIRKVSVVSRCAFYSVFFCILPRIPTAKYPNRAMMKRIQQRTSVQPLCTAEAESYKMTKKERCEYNIKSLQNESHLLWMGPLKFGSYFLDSPVVENKTKQREREREQQICHSHSRNKDRQQSLQSNTGCTQSDLAQLTARQVLPVSKCRCRLLVNHPVTLLHQPL